MSEETNNLPEGEEPLSPESNAEKELETVEGLTAEEQLARQKIVEFLNERQRKAVEAKEAGKRGFHDLNIAMYEALREATNAGNFDQAVPYSAFSQSGKEVKRFISVEEYLNKLVQDTSDRVMELEERGDEESRKKLKGTYKFFDVAEETLNAVEAAQTKKSERSEGNDEREGANNTADVEPPEDREPPEPPEGVENQEQYEPEDPWLDVRRIKELKEEFQRKYNVALEEEKARRRRLQDDTPVVLTPQFVDILKTHVIESSISRAIEHAQRNNERFGTGKIPEQPSEETKQKMAEMMDTENLDLEQEIDRADHHRFKTGQKVKYALPKGKIETDWQVDRFIDNPVGNQVTVVLTKEGRSERYPSQEELLRMQTLKEGIDDELELVKEYFNQPVKVKLENGEIIEGVCRGLSLHGGIYVEYPKPPKEPDESDKDYNRKPPPLKLISTEEFLGWQKEEPQTTEEPEDTDAEPSEENNNTEEHPSEPEDTDEATPPDRQNEAEVNDAGVASPTTGPETPNSEEEEREQLTPWAWTTKEYNKLNRRKKLIVSFLGLCVASTGPGLILAGGMRGMRVHHGIHNRRLKKQQERSDNEVGRQ